MRGDNFREIFAKFSQVFRSFRKLFEDFGLALTCPDLLGCVRMRWDASGWVRMHLDAFGKIQKTNPKNSVEKISFCFLQFGNQNENYLDVVGFIFSSKHNNNFFLTATY